MSQEEKPYGAAATAWHQQVSKSDPCDALGGISKKSQQINSGPPAEVNAGIPAHPPERRGSKDQKKFDPREPRPKGAYPGGHTTTRSENGAKSKGPKNHLKESGY